MAERTSSNSYAAAQLSSAELYMLEKLSISMILHDSRVALGGADHDVLLLLQSHSFASQRTLSTQQGDRIAWDITTEGLRYLVRQYRKRGGHV